jgi:general secretion pathway protein I
VKGVKLSHISKVCRFRHDKHRPGFTLLEIMVSLSIIAIVLVSIYKMHAQTISMNYTSRFYATAPLLAQIKIAEFENKTIKEMTDDSGDFGDEYSGYSWRVEVNDVDSEPLGNTSKNLKKIDVTIFLNNDQSIYDIRTYRFLKD